MARRSEPELTREVHLAGADVSWGQRFRQRCAWCGALLVDEERSKLLDEPGWPFWPVGALVARLEGVWYVLAEPGSVPPADCCMLLDPAATR